MKSIKLLAVLAVLSLLVAPALSLRGTGCAGASDGMSESCNDPHTVDCCGHCSDKSCACVSQNYPSSGIEGYDPGYSYLSKGSSRSFSRGYSSASSSWLDESGSCGDPSTGSANIGPPYTKEIEHLPPSAKLVFKVLESDGLLTQKDIISKTSLPGRTVRYALSRLKGENMIQERFCFQDARQTLYGLNISTFEAMRI